MKREERDGQIWLDCSRCGQMFPAFESGSDFSRTMESLYAADAHRHCAKCREELSAEA